MRETLSFLVLNSLEGKDDPCKSDCPTFYHLWKISCTLPVILLNSLERKDDPCKGDSQHITLLKKKQIFQIRVSEWSLNFYPEIKKTVPLGKVHEIFHKW